MPAATKPKPNSPNRDTRTGLTAAVRPAKKDVAPVPHPNLLEKLTHAALAAVLICTTVIYVQVAWHPFINYDDPGYVTENQNIQSGLTWKTISWAATAVYEANWHPLTWISHALDVQLFGLNPAGHHLTNLFLHVLNVAILYFLLSLATRSPWRSLLVTALFALHPLNVESVAWIAERKNLLSTLFFFLALGAYGWYVRQPRVGRYLLVAGLFLLGLASKPMVITLPCVLVLLDFWPLQRIRSGPSGFTLRQSIVEKLPLVALVAVSAVLTLHAQKGSMMSIADLSLWVRIQNAIYAYAMYIAKALWPAGLAPIYPHPKDSLTFFQVGFSAVIVAAISYFSWQQRTLRPYLLTGWLWFLGTLVPVIGIIQVGRQAMADRYAYIPLFGLFVMVVWGLAELAEKLELPAPAKITFSAIALAMLAFLTWRQTGFWRSKYDLWAHSVAVTQDNEVAETNLGMALIEQGRVDEAAPHFQNVLRINPQSYTSYFNLAVQLQTQGRLSEAIGEYEIALHATSDAQTAAGIFINLWTIYTQLHDFPRASESFKLAAQAYPPFVVTLLPSFVQSVETNPNPQNCFQLGQLMEHAGFPERARASYQQSLQLDPSYEAARQALARLGQAKG